MLALIKGKTLVKGQSAKEVEYIGCVQTDGYVYYNDERFYRASPTATLDTTTEVTLDNVQQWYSQQNRWIRSNVFTDLKAKGFDSDQIAQQIDAAAQAAQAAAQAASQAGGDAGLADTHIKQNGNVLYNAVQSLNRVITVVNAQHAQSISQVTGTIYR